MGPMLNKSTPKFVRGAQNGQICTGACVQVTKNCVAGAQTGPEATRGGSLRVGGKTKT